MCPVYPSQCNEDVDHFFLNPADTTEIYTLSLHDALPILALEEAGFQAKGRSALILGAGGAARASDRKSTRLNSSPRTISYAVFCLKKKKKKRPAPTHTNPSGALRDAAPGRLGRRPHSAAR